MVIQPVIFRSQRIKAEKETLRKIERSKKTELLIKTQLDMMFFWGGRNSFNTLDAFCE